MLAGFTLFENRRTRDLVLLRHAKDGVKGGQFTCGSLIAVDVRRMSVVLPQELSRYHRNLTADISFLDKLNMLERKRFLRAHREVRVTQRLAAVEFMAIQARGSSGMDATVHTLLHEELSDERIHEVLVELFSVGL